MPAFDEQDYTKSFQWGIWKRLMPVMRPYRRDFAGMFAFNLITAAIDVVLPLFQRYAISNYIEAGTLSGLLPYTLCYFGGILLGAGGLVRAYAHGAKIAVDAAGRSIKRIWTNVYLPCPYSWYERIRLEVAAFGGMIRETQFGADVELDLLLPEEQTQGFLERVTDLSAGTIEGLIGKQEYRAFPLP